MVRCRSSVLFGARQHWAKSQVCVTNRPKFILPTLGGGGGGGSRHVDEPPPLPGIARCCTVKMLLGVGLLSQSVSMSSNSSRRAHCDCECCARSLAVTDLTMRSTLQHVYRTTDCLPQPAHGMVSPRRPSVN